MRFSIAKYRGFPADAWIAVSALVVAAVSLATTMAGPRFTEVVANPTVSIEIDDLHSGEVRFFTYKIKQATRFDSFSLVTQQDDSKPPSTPANAATCITKGTSVLGKECSAGFAVTDTSWNRWNPGSHRASP